MSESYSESEDDFQASKPAQRESSKAKPNLSSKDDDKKSQKKAPANSNKGAKQASIVGFFQKKWQIHHFLPWRTACSAEGCQFGYCGLDAHTWTVLEPNSSWRLDPPGTRFILFLSPAVNTWYSINFEKIMWVDVFSSILLVSVVNAQTTENFTNGSCAVDHLNWGSLEFLTFD